MFLHRALGITNSRRYERGDSEQRIYGIYTYAMGIIYCCLFTRNFKNHENHELYENRRYIEEELKNSFVRMDFLSMNEEREKKERL